MILSIQQIKFDLLSYIKEFGGDSASWHIGTAEDAAEELFDTLGVDRRTDIWLWKPAASPKAAKIIAQWMVDKQKASAVATVRSGPSVVLYKLAQSHPSG